MPHDYLFLLILVGVSAVIIIGHLSQKRRSKKYLLRPCTGIAWRRRFPHVSPDELRKFLSLFGESFGFSAKQQLCFHPDDTIEEVYQCLYPPNEGLTPDALECETFAEDIEKEYGLCLTSIQISLGDLFSMTRRHS